MKQLNNFINEKLIINKNIKINKYNYQPKDKFELNDLIKKLLEERGLDADLNDIDISKITDMNFLFDKPSFSKVNKYDLCNFNGDISKWDVSNVKSMVGMFLESKFNGDISNWDVSKVERMDRMFEGSKFTGENGDISNWDVSNVKNMSFMFNNSKFNGDISNWDVSNVKSMAGMFLESKFNGDISNWDVNNVKDMINIFNKCPLEKNPPKWYKE